MAAIHIALTGMGFYAVFSGYIKQDWTYFMTILVITGVVCTMVSSELANKPSTNSRPYAITLFGVVLLHSAYGILIGGKLIPGWLNDWFFAYTMIIFICAVVLWSFTQPQE